MGTWEMGGRAHRGRGGQLGTEEEEEEEGPSSVPNCDVLQSSLKEEEEEEEEEEGPRLQSGQSMSIENPLLDVFQLPIVLFARAGWDSNKSQSPRPASFPAV